MELDEFKCVQRFPFGITGRWVVTGHQRYLNKPLVCLNLKLAWVTPQWNHSIRLSNLTGGRPFSHVDETQSLSHTSVLWSLNSSSSFALYRIQFKPLFTDKPQLRLSNLLHPHIQLNKNTSLNIQNEKSEMKIKAFRLVIVWIVCTICTYNKIIIRLII